MSRRGDHDTLMAGDDDVAFASQLTPAQKARRCFCIFIAVLLSLIFIGAIIILVLLIVMVGAEPPRVKVDCGYVEGTVDLIRHVYSFKGVPFAASPIGERRWQAPVPLTNGSKSCWSGTYKALNHAAECAQIHPGTDKVTGKEDCLYLDIFTPSIDPMRKLPVMMYIHGGYLLFGNNSIPGYVPTAALADELQIVFVNIQYRLNSLGFLVSDLLPDKQTGNYGFLDQIEALKWIQRNIENFGGDPKEVAISGQSSGGTSVFALMVSPLAKGLFQRAWMISSSPLFNATIEDGKEAANVFLNEVGCTNATKDCLTNLSYHDVVKASSVMYQINVPDSNDLPTKGVLVPPLNVIDGHVIPKNPFDIWKEKEGSFSDVPLLIGTTAQEIDSGPTPPIDDWDEQKYVNYVTSHLDPFDETENNFSQEAIDRYNNTFPNDVQYQFTTMVSDIRVNCGNDILASKASDALEHVYRYVVTSRPSSPVKFFGSSYYSKYSFHGWDVFALFDIGKWMSESPRTSDFNFRKVLINEVINFVKTGKPQSERWERYPNATALLGSELEVIKNGKTYHEDDCKFWSDYGLDKYAWIN